ncbi:MAG TPA: hypothetical protein V6D27_08065, partial [Vampirovibrionales bacterium]
ASGTMVFCRPESSPILLPRGKAIAPVSATLEGLSPRASNNETRDLAQATYSGRMLTNLVED